MNGVPSVQKLWNYCTILRDDGMSYGDYVEQLTYLLFREMADERSRPPYTQLSLIPAQFACPSLSPGGRTLQPVPPGGVARSGLSSAKHNPSSTIKGYVVKSRAQQRSVFRV